MKKSLQAKARHDEAQALHNVRREEEFEIARAVVRERKIPFEIQASKEVTRTSGMQAFHALRAETKKNGVQDLTLAEINEEIRQARYGGR